MTIQHNTKIVTNAQTQLLYAGGDKTLSDSGDNDSGDSVYLAGCDLKLQKQQKLDLIMMKPMIMLYQTLSIIVIVYQLIE